MIARIPKETCQPCNKFISIGQPVLECENCFTAIHTKCFKVGKFACTNNLWLCPECLESTMPRYNPFAYINRNQLSDKFHENDYEGVDDTLQCVTAILEACQPYNDKEIQKLSEHLKNTDSPSLSTMFLNIDGNHSNFNSLLIELKRLRHSFPVIGLAETNIDEPLKNLYTIPKYTSF